MSKLSKEEIGEKFPEHNENKAAGAFLSVALVATADFILKYQERVED